jgi:hypothetical protein
VNCRGAQHATVGWPPFTFGRLLWPSLEFSPRASAGPKAAAQGDEEVGHPGKLVRVQQVVVLLTDPHFAAHGRHLYAQVQIITRQVPLCHAPHAGNLNEVIGAC